MSNFADTMIDSSGQFVRRAVRQVAKSLNFMSGGKLSANTVTFIGLIAHLPIAWLIATKHNLPAAILLVIFGLFDTLDGELARLQGKDSPSGMLFDAVSDRFKEVLIFSGAAYSFISSHQPYLAVWAVVALGSSLIVSYVKAKAETAALVQGHSPKSINSLFKDGLMRFEVRMILIIIGLLANQLGWAIILIGILSAFTAIQRLFNSINKINV